VNTRVHQVRQHTLPIAGLEAVSLRTEHAFPRHSHDQFGIGLFHQGAQHSWSHIGKVETQAGDSIMVNPGEIHDGHPLDGPRSWQMIYIDPALIGQVSHGSVDVQRAVMRPVVKDPLLTGQLQRLFAEITAPVADETAIEDAFLLSLMRVTQHHLFSPVSAPGHSPAIAQAKAWIDDAPEEKISLEALATCCGISRFQLIRGFSRELGVTPHAYLVQSRVRLARHLLLAGNTLIDAALMAGFADQSHLTRAFYRQFGVTPGYFLASTR
jgi:AraC-like DNA-binding protein